MSVPDEVLQDTVAVAVEDLPISNVVENQDEDQHLQHQDSDPTPPSNGHQEIDYEFFVVHLSELRKEFQCPICLGIIRKTRTVMECLHRFCRECIDKSMRLGNKECPACRTHCASRRSLRDDQNFDTLIAVLYPNVDEFEEEEMAFHEEDDARNKQIQASIAQTFHRQSEAVSKKRKRSQSSTKRRVSYRSDDNDDANGNSSSADERQETRPKRSRRSKREQSPAAENNPELGKETIIPSLGLVGCSDMLAWGKGGTRSHTRYGAGSAAAANNAKYARNNRLARLTEHLRNLDESPEMDLQILLVSLDAGKAPSLQKPYLCCKPTLAVGQIRQFIAFETSSEAEEIEVLALKEMRSKTSSSSFLSLNEQPSESSLLDPCKDELQPLLNSSQTLEEVKSEFHLQVGHLILAYRHKSADPGSRNKAAAAAATATDG